MLFQDQKSDRHRKQSSGSGRVGIKVAFRRQTHVMHAVILRDIRSRYFNHGLGFLVVPMFPVAHVIILLVLYNITGREAVFGDDLALFFATGLIPVLTFIYISRFMSVSVTANKGMLAFPAVHLLDIILARAFLEFLAIIISIFIITIVLISLGSNPVPRDPTQALLAMFVVAVLSIGVGTVVSIASAISPIVSATYSLFTAVIYLSSNAPIFLHTYPEELIYFCSFNPVFHAVEWMRSAYYLGYPTQYLDKFYLIAWAFGCLPLGLLAERALRPQIMNG